MIDENDLVKLFANNFKKKPDPGEVFFGILYKIMLFGFIFVVVYGAINFGALKEKISFWYKNDVKAEPYTQDTAVPSITTPDAQPKETKPDLPEMAENTIYIPSLNIKAPITWRVNNTSREVSSSLENGVIQLAGTALPGEKGNIYITGHSSNYIWAKGDYNNVFALLNNLAAGDLAYIKFENTTYIYKIKDQKIVLATDMSVLNKTTDSRLTMVTCWPVGTSLKRLVVTANQVYPNPKQNKDSSQSVEFDKLPGAR
jgi:LPXTG-site transpeptidase (sortase) family protein